LGYLPQEIQRLQLRSHVGLCTAFDGFRAKVGEVQLEVTEDFIARAKTLPLEGEKWFKNSKMEDVPGSLFMVSLKPTCFPKGIPITFLKPR